jgi:hypothetical protein
LKTKQLLEKLSYIWIGPFKIKEKIREVNFKLKLWKNMKQHPVFHKSFFEKVPKNVKIIIEDLELDPKAYEVEKLLDFRY